MTRRPGDRDIGDGDRCPVNPDHGNMYVIQNAQRQWCVHNDHDGRPKSAPGGPQKPTPNIWPLGDKALADAIAKWTLTRGQKESTDG